MKRVSITLGDDLEVAVEGYVSIQEAKPSLAAVVQTALRQFLIDKGCLETPRRASPPKLQRRGSGVAPLSEMVPGKKG